MPSKSVLSSKTVWFNLAAGILGVLQSSGVVNLIPAPYGPALWALGNLILRVVTTQPVTVG